jgi:hypothetical protein
MEQLTEEQLAAIEQMAALQFSPQEVAIITGAGDAGAEFQALSEFSQAMLRGNLREQALVRTGIFQHAKNGSSPAQVLALQLIEQYKVSQAGE